MTLLSNPRFSEAFERLAGVTLDPRRHTASDARAHSLAVSARARALAGQNGRSDAEIALLGDLGLCHDIGKLSGSTHPARSLDVLADLGVDDPGLLALVKRHDLNLPWYLAAQRGEAPTDRAWRRLDRAVDLDLLALFMVADRVDAPGGWRRNAPLCWFVEQLRDRGLVGELSLDVPGVASEISAGGVLVDRDRALVIRVRDNGFELPKGGIELGELPREAAVRELREETGVSGDLSAGARLGTIDYDTRTHRKRVHYFHIERPSDGPLAIGPLPAATRERRWIDRDELAGLPLVAETLRPIIEKALQSTSRATSGQRPEGAKERATVVQQQETNHHDPR